MTLAEEPEQPKTCASNDCFGKPSSCSILQPVESFPWTEEDTYYTKLFRAWDNLPIHNASEETGLLMELDHIISHFDSYTRHSDLGFRSWVKRHQLAMEVGLVATPTWPKLYAVKGGKTKWRDEVWVSRYSFLVHQRDIIAKSRLQRMTGCKLEDKKRFFGLSWAYPRQTVRTVQSKCPARLRNRWYEPVDACLLRMAHESYGRLDICSLHAEFWGLGAGIGDTSMTSNSEVKCETVEKAETEQLDALGE